MNRRVVLRTLSLTAAGAALGGRLLWKDADTAASYSIVTDDAESVIARLRDFGVDRQSGFLVSASAIAPTHQDLAVVRSGKLIEPDDLDGWAADLMSELRAQTASGNSLVTAERVSSQAPGTVDFRVDGRLVERVALDRDYRHIEVSGAQGVTVFAVTDGQISVRSSSCRRKLCRKCGSVQSGRIVCAPNHLVATVAGTTPSQIMYDAITG